jgi:DNA-binding protein
MDNFDYKDNSTEIIRITQNGKQRNYISYVEKLFNIEDEENNNIDTVIFHARGRAMAKVITIVEVIKQISIDSLYQTTELFNVNADVPIKSSSSSSSLQSDDEMDEEISGNDETDDDNNEFEDEKLITKSVSEIRITLSKRQLNENKVGYQSPNDIIQHKYNNNNNKVVQRKGKKKSKLN